MTTKVFPGSQTVRQPELIDLDKIQGAPYNPPGRVSERALKKLIASMDDIGLLYPVLVNDSYVLIDGHRRVAAARRLGWVAIPAVVVLDDDVQPDKAYASVNGTSQKMSGNDALRVWVQNPLAVHRSKAVQFEEMARILGAPTVKKMAEEGWSYSTYNIARRIAFYCGREGDEFVAKTFHWLTTKGAPGRTFNLMRAGHPPSVFIKAINANRPVVVRLDVEG